MPLGQVNGMLRRLAHKSGVTVDALLMGGPLP